MQTSPVPQQTRPLEPIAIRFGRLGDMVMVTAALQLLHRRFSKPCVVLGAGPWNLQLFIGHPDVARAYSFTRHFAFMLTATWWRVLRELRRTAPGPIYIFENSPRQLRRIRMMLALSGIDPGRCVFAVDESIQENEPWVDFFVRVAQRMPRALNELGVPPLPPDWKLAPRLSVLESDRKDVEAGLRAQGWTGQKLVLIQPGNFRTRSRGRERWERSAADDKAWPLENWAALLHKIGDSFADVWMLLCGAPQEAELLERVKLAAALPCVRLAAVPLRPMLALCELADSMISIDTGPAHAAAALGLPLVVMYGAQSPGQWLPRSPTGSAVVGIGGPPNSNRVDQIPVDAVFNAWRSLPAASETTPVAQALNEEVSCE